MMRRSTGVRTTVLVLALASWSGCTDSLAAPDAEHARIRAQRAFWESQDISDYTFETRRRCYCGFVGWVEVTVQSDTVQSVRAIEDEETPAWGLTGYPTVDGLFDILEDALDRDAAQIDVTWHETLGYPVSFYIDYSRNIADEELGHDVRVLTVDP